MQFFRKYLRYPLNVLFVLRVWFSYYWFTAIGPLFGDKKFNEGLKKRHRKFAQLFFNRAIKYKGLLIKIGQIMSSRADVLPAEYIEVLSKLQDRIPPVSYEEVERTIKNELNKPIDEVFDNFAREPIASASLGQVHQAFLKDGRKVAVKVQYPGMESIVQADLSALRFALFLYSLKSRVNVKVLFEEFKRVLLGELNYMREGRFAERFRKLFGEDNRVIAPRIMWDFTSTKVLTMEFVAGEKINDFTNRETDPVRRRKIVERLVEVYAAQIFKYGFFHADPHPGNIFITANDEIVFVDFGICSELEDDTREGLRFMARAVIEFDVERMVEGIKRMGVISLDEDERRTRDLLLYAVREFKDISPKEFRDRRQISEWFNRLERYFNEVRSFQVPHKILLFLRTVTILEGHLASLDPNVNLIHIAKPHIRRFVMDDKPIAQIIVDGVVRFFNALYHLPFIAEKFLERTNRGDTYVQTADVSFARLVSLLPALFFAAMTIALLFGIPILVAYDEIKLLYPTLGASIVFFFLTIRTYYRALRR